MQWFTRCLNNILLLNYRGNGVASVIFLFVCEYGIGKGGEDVAVKYRSKFKMSFMMGTTIGVVICLLLWVGVSAISTSLILNGALQTKSLQWIAPISQGVITFLGTLIAGRIIDDKKHISSLICGAIYLGITTCFALLFTEGLHHGYWIGMACIAIGCFAASFSYMTKKRIKPSKRRGMRFR